MKVLTENKEELAIKDLIESDIDDIPAVREREHHEEVNIDELDGFGEVDADDDNAFEDSDPVDLDDELGFDSSVMFDDDDDEIDTTIPDGDMFDDDLFDDEENE